MTHVKVSKSTSKVFWPWPFDIKFYSVFLLSSICVWRMRFLGRDVLELSHYNQVQGSYVTNEFDPKIYWCLPFGEHKNFPSLKLIEIVIMWVYYTIPFGLSLFGHFLVISFQLLILHVWLRITDEGSVPEMRIWSISLIKFRLKMVYTS